MIPVLYKFSFDNPWVLYLVALGLVAYAAWAGYRGAHGPLDQKTGEFAPPSREEQRNRALLFGVIGLVLAGVGLHYALPQTFFGKGKGEGIPIHTYGVLVGAGFICAVTVTAWLAQREWPGEEGLKKRDQVFDLAFWVFLGAMVGSRVLFIIVNWEQYRGNLGRVFSLEGGLVFYGGLIGAAITGFFYTRKHGIDFFRLGDIALPAVSLGQCLGRLGCFGSGCCWGRIAPQGTSWAVHFPGTLVKNLFGGPGPTPSLAYQSQREETRYVLEQSGEVFQQAVPGAERISQWVLEHGHTLPVYPTQLMESFGQLLIFILMLSLRPFRRFHGQLFGLWLVCYGVLRFSVELFRGDLERGTLHGFLVKQELTSLAVKVPLEAWYNISISQFISLCIFSFGATVLFLKARERMARRVELPSLASA